MGRNPNTNEEGKPFDEATVDLVWAKATPVPDSPGVAQDVCGAIIIKSRHGVTDRFGWEIDHITPVALGGSDELANLQPLQWENNRHKGDEFPDWTCKVKI